MTRYTQNDVRTAYSCPIIGARAMDNDEQRDYAEEQYNRRLLTEERDEYDEELVYLADNGLDSECEWCQGSNEDAQSPETLCRAHLAEYEGLSVDELDRRDREEAWDLL